MTSIIDSFWNLLTFSDLYHHYQVFMNLVNVFVIMVTVDVILIVQPTNKFQV